MKFKSKQSRSQSRIIDHLKDDKYIQESASKEYSSSSPDIYKQSKSTKLFPNESHIDERSILHSPGFSYAGYSFYKSDCKKNDSIDCSIDSVEYKISDEIHELHNKNIIDTQIQLSGDHRHKVTIEERFTDRSDANMVSAEPAISKPRVCEMIKTIRERNLYEYFREADDKSLFGDIDCSHLVEEFLESFDTKLNENDCEDQHYNRENNDNVFDYKSISPKERKDFYKNNIIKSSSVKRLVSNGPKVNERASRELNSFKLKIDANNTHNKTSGAFGSIVETESYRNNDSLKGTSSSK